MLTGSRWVIILNGFQTIVQQILRESFGYSSQRGLDYFPVDSQGVAGLFFSTGSRLLSSRFTGSRSVILLNGFQTIVQQIHRETLGYSSQRVPGYCTVDSQGVAGHSSQRFPDYCPVEIHRESLGYSSQQVLDYCPLDIHRESLGYSSQRVLDYCPVESQGVAGLFFSTGSRLFSSRFTGSRWVILLNGFQTIAQQIHRESLGYSSQRVLDNCPVDSQRDAGLFFSTGSRLLSSRYSQGVADYCSQRFLDYCPVEIDREKLFFFSQRILDYCRVDSQGAAGLLFSIGSRQLSSRFTGSRWVILLNGFQTIVQQIFTGSRWVILLNGFQTIVQQIHRESPGYSSQRVLDYCSVDSRGVPGLFFSTGSRLLSSRFTGSRWVILLDGFKTIVQQIHRESLGYSSQRVLDNCPVDSEKVVGLFFPTGSRLLSSRYSQGVAVLFFSTGSRLLSSRFTGSRWVILLNGFQTIVQQIQRKSLGYSSQRVPDCCPVDIHRVLLCYSSQRVLDYCPVDINSELLGYSSQRVLDYCSVDSRDSLGYCSQRVLDNCPVEIHRETLGYSSQQVLDYCPVDIHRESLIIVLNGFQTIVQQRLTGRSCCFFLNGFSTIVEQIHREPLGYSSQSVQDNCPVDSQGVAGLFFSTDSKLLSSRYLLGVAGLFFSTGSRLLSSRFTGSRRVILLSGFQTIVQQIHGESLGYSSQRVLDYCQVDSQGVAGLFCSTGSRQLSSRFTGSRWVILLNGFQTIVQQIQRKSLGYSSQRVQDYCPVDSQGVAGLFFSTGSRLLFSRFTGLAGLLFTTGSRQLSSRDSQGVAGLFFSTGSRPLPGRCSQGVVGLLFSTGSRLLSSRFSGSRLVILLNGVQTIFQQIHRESLGYSSQRVLDYCPVDSQGVARLFFSTGSRQLSSRFTGRRWVILLNGFQAIVQQILRESLVILLNGFQTIVQQRFTGSRWVILLNRFQTIVHQIFTGSRWVILLNRFQTIVQQIFTGSR